MGTYVACLIVGLVLFAVVIFGRMYLKPETFGQEVTTMLVRLVLGVPGVVLIWESLWALLTS